MYHLTDISESECTSSETLRPDSGEFRRSQNDRVLHMPTAFLFPSGHKSSSTAGGIGFVGWLVGWLRPSNILLYLRDGSLVCWLVGWLTSHQYACVSSERLVGWLVDQCPSNMLAYLRDGSLVDSLVNVPTTCWCISGTVRRLIG